MAFIHRIFKDLRSPLYKNAIFLMWNSVLGSGLGFFFWMVVARSYTPYDVGLAASIIPIMGLIAILSSFGLDEALVRFMPSNKAHSRALINSCFTISGIAAFLISFLFLLGLDFWSPALLFIRDNWIFFASFLVFSVALTLFPMMNQVFVARRDAKFVLAGRAITGLRVPLAVVFAAFFGAFGIFVSWGVAVLIALLAGIVVFMPRVNPGYKPMPTVRKSAVSDMLHFSADNYVVQLVRQLPVALIPLLVVNTLSADSVAYYYIAFTVAGLLFALIGAVCTSLFAEGSHSEKELNSIVRRALKLMFLLLVPCVIVILLFGEHLLLLFGSKYSLEGLTLLQIYAVSSILVAFNGIFIATRKVLKQMKPAIVISIYRGLAMVGFAYVFLHWMGLVGIAVAFALCTGTASVGIAAYLMWTRIR